MQQKLFQSHMYYSNGSAAYLSLNINNHSICDCKHSIALIKSRDGGIGVGILRQGAFMIGIGIFRLWEVPRGSEHIQEELGNGTK
jgi:hypothetical protein